MKNTPVLVVRDGELAGRRWAVDQKVMLLGRGADCDIFLAERQISRHHLRILHEPKGYFIQDLDSKNGTQLNGVIVHGRAKLEDGDEIMVGKAISLIFVGTDATVPLPRSLINQIQPPLVLDKEQRCVIIRGKELSPPLSLAQFRLIETLYDADGSVCSRDDIIAAVWPGTEGIGVTEQAIDALIRRLRDRLSTEDSHNFIVTVRGHGFRLDNQ